MKEILTVAELFAGVGGFRIGLEGFNGKSSTSNFTEEFNSPFKVIWSNQWEPSTKVQHASNVYESKFGSEGHVNQDITTVDTNTIPDVDVLTASFPCQNYSVASTTKNAKGLLGKKGVLWWSIYKILSEKENKPKYLIMENVDRLINSPSSQKGRDFAVILKSLDNLGYAVEWRIINAAEYGFPQRRKRIFILAYLKDSPLYNEIAKTSILSKEWVLNSGIIANAFPVCNNVSNLNAFGLTDDIITISNTFHGNKNGSFENTGIMINSVVVTMKTTPCYISSQKRTVLGDILENNISNEFFIDDEELKKWVYLKGPKKFKRTSADGFEYTYSEGGMGFPDQLDKPSRTIITGEGGRSASRFKHVISTENGHRRLTPIELERLSMFPDNHTKMNGISDTKRAFFIGNALVVGVVEKLGVVLSEKINKITN